MPSLKTTPTALTIAGSDSGGGAGIQADLKTFAAHGVYGTCAITALTAQNTQAVQGVWPVAPEFVGAQMASVLSDMPVTAIKTGMLYSADIIRAVSDALAHTQQPLVLDPVMQASSGASLLDNHAISALCQRLIPRATLLTPNLPEAALLLNARPALALPDMIEQAAQLLALGPQAVLLKGGHLNQSEAVDVYCDAEGAQLLRAPRLQTPNTHGTGCTLAAAIVARLAQGDGLLAACRAAKAYLQNALAHAEQLQVGAGRGPVHHFYALCLTGQSSRTTFTR